MSSSESQLAWLVVKWQNGSHLFQAFHEVITLFPVNIKNYPVQRLQCMYLCIGRSVNPFPNTSHLLPLPLSTLSSVEAKYRSNVSKNVECGFTGPACYVIKCHFGAKSEPGGKGHFARINSDRCIFLLLEKKDFTCCKFSWKNTSPLVPGNLCPRH